MNQKQAEKLMHNVHLGVWEKGCEKLLAKYYYPKVIGHYRDTVFGMAEIKNRMAYMKARYRKRKWHITEVISIDAQTIFARVRQTGIDVYYKKPYSSDVIGIYKVLKGKIKEVWVIIDGEMNYLANPQELNTTMPPLEKFTFDAVDKKCFKEKINAYQYFYRTTIVPLSRREEECLYYFLNGYSAKETGKILKLTHRTVQAYLENVKAKYNCSSKNELRQKIFPTGL